MRLAPYFGVGSLDWALPRREMEDPKMLSQDIRQSSIDLKHFETGKEMPTLQTS